MFALAEINILLPGPLTFGSWNKHMPLRWPSLCRTLSYARAERHNANHKEKHN